jgi:hypothetical protein
MNISGKGFLVLDYKKYPAYFNLNDENMVLSVQLWQDTELVDLAFKNPQEFRNISKCSIESVNFILPFGKLQIEDLPVIIKSFNPGTLSIYDLPLFRGFQIFNNKNIGVTTVILEPAFSEIKCTWKPDYSVPENNYIIFRNFSIQLLEPYVSIRVGNDKFLKLSQTDNIAIISFDNVSEKETNNLREKICLALGLAQGRFPDFYIVYIYPQTLKINLKSNSNNSFRLVNGRNLVTFIECFIVFFEKLTPTDKLRWKRAVMSYVEGKKSSLLIETRFLSLFTAFEIWDGSRSLTKNSLQDLFKLSTWDARFILELRHGIVHIGLEVLDAIENAKNLANEHENDLNSIFKKIYSICNSFELITQVYLCIIERLDNYILSNINYKGNFYAASQEFKEVNIDEKLNKIILRDKKVLDTLAKM